MQLKRYDQQAGHFYRDAHDFLMQHEAEHNLMIGLASRIADGSLTRFTDPYLALVSDDAGAVVAAALMTPPNNLLLSRVEDPTAYALLAADLQTRFPLLPGVTASVPYARHFADAWQRAAGQPYELRMPQRIYQIAQVRPPEGVSGSLRPAAPEDRELLVRWLMAFNNEALDEDDDDETMQRQGAERLVDHKLSAPLHRDTFYLWQNPEPVAMVACAGPTPNGIRINAVYTPPEHRRKGYGSAATAAISQLMFDQGRLFCFLYTDLNNPTSNRIYQNIGYTPVADVEYLAFEIED